MTAPVCDACLRRHDPEVAHCPNCGQPMGGNFHASDSLAQCEAAMIVAEAITDGRLIDLGDGRIVEATA